MYNADSETRMNCFTLLLLNTPDYVQDLILALWSGVTCGELRGIGLYDPI